jgi:uncharacterized protein (UPF0332 family)
MRSNNFLSKLKTEGKLELIEPSDDICESYSKKSADCLRSAKVLLQNELFENSIGMSYYAMYNLLLSLLFKTGIKCENHGASILLLQLVYGENVLSTTISDAKKERIDKQYYVSTEKEEITKEVAEELFHSAEELVLSMKVLLRKIDNDELEAARERFSELTG